MKIVKDGIGSPDLKIEAARSFPKNFCRSLSILDGRYRYFLSLSILLYPYRPFFILNRSSSILMNSKKLLRNFEFSKSQDRIFSTAVVDPKEEPRGHDPSSVFLKDKNSTHTFNNKMQNCMECNLYDPPRVHMREHRLLDDIAISIA